MTHVLPRDYSMDKPRFLEKTGKNFGRILSVTSLVAYFPLSWFRAAQHTALRTVSAVVLTEAFFAQSAGWEAMKRARSFVQMDQVLSSDWSAPLLKGVVQDGSTSYRAGLVIKSSTDIENICTCRPSREWGTLCAHSVAVGLHYLQAKSAPGAVPITAEPRAVAPATKPSGQRLRRAAADGPGEPAELFIILPPNLDQALTRGQVMLCFEGKVRSGRSPLSALPKSQPFLFSPQDAALLDKIETLAGGDTPAMLRLSATDFAALLWLLVGHPRLTLGKSAALTVTDVPLSLPVRAILQANGEIELSLTQSAPRQATIANEWIFQNQTLQPLGLPQSLAELLRGTVRLSRLQVPPFLNQDWPRLAALEGVTANFRLEDFTLEILTPRVQLQLTGGLAQLQAQLYCVYGPQRFLVRGRLEEGSGTNEGSPWLPDPQDPKHYGARDLSAERGALGHLVQAGFAGPDTQGSYHLQGQNAVLNFFARVLPRLQREWEVTLEERLQRSTAQNLERVEPQFRITPSGVQWFDLDVSFHSPSGERFSAADIQRLILSGQSHSRLQNGKLALIDTGAVEELQEVLRDCSPEQRAGRYRISHAQAGFVDATLRLHAGWRVLAPPAWRDGTQPGGDGDLPCPPLGQLEAVLRPYQKIGVAWLHFLRRNGFGGILADEMGLGKTLQVLAFVQTIRSPHGASATAPASGPILVVCPSSLIFNWVAEAHRFTPDLKVLAVQGPDRHALFDQIPRSDLIVTSYALLRRDAESYNSREFDTVVLDEAQHIKNRQTQNAQAVKAVPARHRLVLTGTPLENSVLDLWSIFDFLMPGYLGTAPEFHERYERPITNEKNSAAQARLGRRLRPFIFRRLKREVAPELPERIDQVSFCELNEEQQTVYQQVLEACRKEVLDAAGPAGLARSRMVVLTALLRLRQICCDLRLLKLAETRPSPLPSAGDEPELTATKEGPRLPSGKLELFRELLEEILDGGHRVLVFSQFTSLLALLRDELAKDEVPFCYLDGSTPNRGEVVARFQQSRIPVFLISLKAGGVGLNLTGADTVMHFDPWWNPAVEDQATDRAHRIGQRQVVTSYKLITRNTVEEKILLLQQRKRQLIRATLEENFAETLSWEEIQDLIR
jgi:superfamily II DNA or RNA helicase